MPPDLCFILECLLQLLAVLNRLFVILLQLLFKLHVLAHYLDPIIIVEQFASFHQLLFFLFLEYGFVRELASRLQLGGGAAGSVQDCSRRV